MIEEQGYLAWLVRGMAPAFISAFILMIALPISVRSGTEMARRPWWYVVVLATGSAVATLLIWVIELALPSGNVVPVPVRLLDGWLTVMVFGGVFGWAAVLNIKRTEERAALTQLLVRRSLLARKVAQAQLFAARAQVDPDMVARVLSQVRRRYQNDAAAAGVLLDQLIAFLRLAMNRKGALRAPLGSELEMMRGYAALRAAETGGLIDLQIRLDPEVQQLQPAAAPFFLLLRHVLREVPPAPSALLVLEVHIGVDALQLVLQPGDAPTAPDVLQRLRTGLREILAGTQEVDILHEPSDTGVHRYVVQAAIE